PEKSAPKIPIIPKTNKPPAAIEKIDVSSIKRAPSVPTDLWDQSTSNNERTSKPSNVFGDDQLSQSASSLESDYDSVYEDLNDKEDVEEQRESESESYLEAQENVGRELVRQGEHNSLVEINDGEAEERYDQVMTGWDPVPLIAGRKRSRSPEDQTTYSKRGRPIKKVDYYKLHHGKTLKGNADPKTWTEAMESADRQHWQLAADEEIESLKKTGTIEVIDRSKLPKGRTPMKCKWVFKKKYHADGTLEK
ncbi:hypothetical protein K3495_g16702, partial [Podosphaera aphanis]